MSTSGLPPDEIEELAAEQQRLREMKPEERPLAFQRWLNFGAEHKSPSDILNRARSYFWYVDGRGRVLRTTIEEPERRQGELRDQKMLDMFFSNVAHNATGRFSDWPFLFRYANERHYVRCSRVSPVLVREIIRLTDSSRALRFTYSPELALPYHPQYLRLESKTGTLVYPRITVDPSSVADPRTILWMSFTNDLATSLGEELDKELQEVHLEIKE